jgi:erythromycin esterase
VALNRFREFSADDRNGYTAAIADLVARFETNRLDYIQRSTEDEYEWAYRSAVATRQLDTGYRAAIAASPPGQVVTEGQNFVASITPARDRGMADNVLWALQREGPNGRLLVWAHDLHLMKGLLPQGKSSRSQGIYSLFEAGPRLGQFLDSILGRDYVNVGSTFYEGAKDGWMPPAAPGLVLPAECGTLDGELARVGLPMFILDLRSARQNGIVYQWLNGARMRGYDLAPAQAWDAVFFIRHISPAQRETGPK